MKDLIDHIPAILLATCALFFLWGLGYIIQADSARSLEFKQHCLENDMQYVSGSCVK